MSRVDRGLATRRDVDDDGGVLPLSGRAVAGGLVGLASAVSAADLRGGADLRTSCGAGVVGRTLHSCYRTRALSAVVEIVNAT